MTRLRWYGKQRMAELNAGAKANVATAGILLKENIKDSFQTTEPMIGKRGGVLRAGPGRPVRFRPSKKDEPPALQTRNLKRSIISENDFDREGPVARVGPMSVFGGVSIKYARFLEFGTRKMFARPFMIPALQRMKRTIATVLARVR